MEEVQAESKFEIQEEEKTYNISELNRLYNESESCDSDVFSEMRSNVLMVAGHHYKKISKALNRNLTNLDVDKSKRLRLIKNHTAKGISDIRDILSSMTPGVLPYPANENVASHTKVAELSKLVWEDGRKKNKFDDLIEQFRNSFTTLGEVCSKVFFDPIGGGLKAYKQKVDPETGAPLFKDPEGNPTIEPGVKDELGNLVQQFEMMPDETQPVFNGKISIEKFEPYNLLRHKNSKSVKTAKFLILRKMVDIQEAKALIKASDMPDKEKEDKLSWIKESGETTYKIFDGMNGSFQDSEGQVMFREYYFRQSPEFPKGYFFITVEKGILFEGEIPFGEEGEDAYPIKWEGYDMYEGSSRGFSPIRRIRPCQAEINRCASSISETQLLMGADKVILQKGSKFSRGVDQPGMRVFYSTSPGDTQVIQGRSGEQYVNYLEFNIDELYKLLNIPENSNPISQNFDPRAELFKKQSQKARFTEPAQRLARFFTENCKTYLFLSQKYADEIGLDNVFGPSLATDSAEFKNANRLSYKIKLLEVGDDLESAMAKTMELDTILQYAGKDIDKDTLKIILSQYPAINKTQAFKHLTLDIKNVESDILALDRGEWRPAYRYDEHPIYVKHLTARMKEKDFSLHPDNIKLLFEKKLKEHETFIKQIAQEEQEAQAGFIPSGGAMVKTDFYINPDPSNPTKNERAMFPTESLAWLKKRLEGQGSMLQMFKDINVPGVNADVAKMLTNGQGPQPGAMMPPAQAPLI